MPRVTFKLFDELDKARCGQTTSDAEIVGFDRPTVKRTPGAYCNLEMIRCLQHLGMPSCRNKDGDFEILRMFAHEKGRCITLRHATDMDKIDGPAMSWEEEEEIPAGWGGFKIACLGYKKKWWQFMRKGLPGSK